MLISEIHTKVKVGLDKIDSLGYPEVLPEEIDVFLNNNILKFVSQRLYGNNARGEGFEETQKRIDDLFTLVKSEIIIPSIPSVSNKPFSVRAVFPTDYWHTIQEEAGITYEDCNGAFNITRVPVYPITHDRYNKIIRDPFNKPDEKGILRLVTDGTIELIGSQSTTIDTYYLRYIKKPAEVRYGTIYSIPTTDIQCDLPESTHHELIAMTITDCLEKIESPRTVISNQLIKEIE